MRNKTVNKNFTIVVAATRKESLGICLRSLFSQNFNQKKLEIIVVSKKCLINRFKSKFKKVKYIEMENENPARRRNLGLKIGSGEIIAFIDDDAYAPKNWLSTAWNQFVKDPLLDGLMGPTLLPKNVSLGEQITDSVLSSKISGHNNFARREYRYHQPSLGDITACNLFVKRKTLGKIGGFNELLGYGGEDSEMVFTALDGYQRKMIYFSKLIVYHHRREFGLGFLKQRFKLRKSTGKLMLVYPSRYFWNRKISVFFIGISLFIFFSLFCPKQAALFFLISLLTLILLSIKVIQKKVLIGLIWPYALIFHFAASYLGLVFGLLSWKEIKKLRRHRRF